MDGSIEDPCSGRGEVEVVVATGARGWRLRPVHWIRSQWKEMRERGREGERESEREKKMSGWESDMGIVRWFSSVMGKKGNR